MDMTGHDWTRLDVVVGRLASSVCIEVDRDDDNAGPVAVTSWSHDSSHLAIREHGDCADGKFMRRRY